MHQDRGIDFVEEFFDRCGIFGDDGFGVVRGIVLDMGDGFVHIGNDFHGNDRVFIFGAPVLFGGRPGRGDHLADGVVAADFAALFDQRVDDGLEVGRDDFLVDEQGFGGAADAGAAHLGVGDHADSDIEIGAFVDIDVDQPFEMGKDRDAGLGLDAAHQALAAAGDDNVDGATKALEHFSHGRSICRWDDLDGVFGQAGGLEALDEACVDGARGMKAVGPTAQDHGIAGLEAQRAGVCGHVGAGLENYADQAKRRAHTGDVEPIGALPIGNDRSDRIGEIGNRFER